MSALIARLLGLGVKLQLGLDRFAIPGWEGSGGKVQGGGWKVGACRRGPKWIAPPGSLGTSLSTRSTLKIFKIQNSKTSFDLEPDALQAIKSPTT